MTIEHFADQSYTVAQVQATNDLSGISQFGYGISPGTDNDSVLNALNIAKRNAFTNAGCGNGGDCSVTGDPSWRFVNQSSWVVEQAQEEAFFKEVPRHNRLDSLS